MFRPTNSISKKPVKVECDLIFFVPMTLHYKYQTQKKFLNKTAWRQKIPLERVLIFFWNSGEGKFRIISIRSKWTIIISQYPWNY